jgi:subtilase family serine protease
VTVKTLATVKRLATAKTLAVVNHWKKVAALCALILALGAPMFSEAFAERADRITQELNSEGMVRMTGSVHPLTKRAADLGSVDRAMRLESLTLNIAPSAAEQAELDTLLAAQQNSQSPQYHQWLTPEEYGARFGLTENDLSRVTEWLVGQGFTVKSVAPSRNRITFAGTVGQAEAAFRTQIHWYRLEGAPNGEPNGATDAGTHISNATEISIPKGLANVVASVDGLSGFRPKPRARVRRLAPESTPEFSSSLTGNHFLTPGDWATIYDVAPIYSAGYTGTGMHIGIAGQTYFPQEDIDNFRAAAFPGNAGLSATKLNMVCISSTDCTDLKGESIGDIGEADLDVEWAGGIAQNATVDFVYAAASDPNQDVISAAEYMVTTYKPKGTSAVVPVISISYGDCETDYTPSQRNSVDQYLMQAAAQGQTVLNSSGDEGAAGCDMDATTATHGAVADYPASSPWITGVGGTTFGADGSYASPEMGANEYWSYSATADTISSALQYIAEVPWNDTAAIQMTATEDDVALPTLSSSGGGVSLYYALPGWQWAPNNYSGTPKRFVPDVAFAATPNHDGYLICTQQFTETKGTPTSNPGSSCMVGFRLSTGGDLTVAGGTSASSPSFGGLVTLLVQKYGPQGLINPKLYGLAQNPATYANVFHDITTGTNQQPCTAGTPGCVGGLVGYAATTGYDMVTGLGSIDGFELYTAMGTTLPATTTSVTASAANVIPGASVTLNAVVASTTPGSITGLVTFEVNGADVGSETLTNGAASLSVTASAAGGFNGGANLITAIYSGDAHYSGSSGTTNVGVPSYGLSKTSGNSVIIAAGSSGTIQLTFASLGGYAGQVTFTPTVTASSNGTVADVTVSAAPITLTSGGTAVSTVTITPNASAALHPPAIPRPAVNGGPAVNAWTGGALIFCTVLLGAPFTLRRRRTMTVLVVAFAVALAGFMVACGSSGGGSSTQSLTATATTVSASPTTVKLGATSTLTATVSPSAATGYVVFTVNGVNLGTTTLNGGVATTSVTMGANYGYGASATANPVKATYGGSSYYASSTASTTVTVAPVRTYTVTLTPTGSGQVMNPTPVVLTVNVP